MSTKKMSRTVVEGGRATSAENDNHYHTRVERRKTKSHLRAVKTQEDFLDSPAFQDRKFEGRSFADSLTVVYRYLQANAGRPWNDVFSELCRKFDRRTMKGWHMIDGHVINMVDYIDRPRYWPRYLDPVGAWVDTAGILRYNDRKRFGKKKAPITKHTHRTLEGVREWLSGRSVEDVGGKLFWRVTVKSKWVLCAGWGCVAIHRVEKELVRTTHGYNYTKDNLFHLLPYTWRRTERLNERALQYWKTLNPVWKTQILEGKL